MIRLNEKGSSLLIVLLAVLLVGTLIVTGFYVVRQAKPETGRNSSRSSEITNFDECVAAGNPVMESFPEQCSANGKNFVNNSKQDDKSQIEEHVNIYCEELGKAYGFPVTGGYFIADRYPDAVNEEGGEVLVFTKGGDFAYGTVDCEDVEGGMGISNNLLFKKQDGKWQRIDEIQAGTHKPFHCDVLEKEAVPVSFLSTCVDANETNIKQR